MAALTVGAHEAKVHFSEYLDRAAHGEVVTITKHGRPVATLMPAQAPDQGREARMLALMARIDKVAKGQTLGGLKIKDMVNEGRP